MKYTVEIQINKPLKEVWAAFDSVENLKKWYPGLVSFEHVSGTPGQVGAVSKLKFDEKNRNIEMTETITERKDGEYLAGVYEANGVKNPSKNYFREENGVTIWRAENEFGFKGLYKILGLMKGMFVKKTTADMNVFKEMVEKGEIK